MKRFVALLIVAAVALGICCFDQTASFAKKRRIKKYYRVSSRKYRRGFYVYKKRPVKLYQEMYLSPKISENDVPNLVVALKDKGASSVRVDLFRNSLIVQYRRRSNFSNYIVQ